MAAQINKSGPQFSPAGGVGTVWKDPNSGEQWKYTAQGWQKDSSNVKQEAQQNNTFEVKPDEEPIVGTLKEGGSSQEQISAALAKRREVLQASGGEEVKVENAPLSFDEYRQKAEEIAGAELTPEDVSQLKVQYQESFGGGQPSQEMKSTDHPFGGLSKQDMLRDAYNNGVTTIAELDKLEKLYDKLVGEEEEEEDDFTPTEIKKLEQAGLKDATRQEKLDYLYGY